MSRIPQGREWAEGLFLRVDILAKTTIQHKGKTPHGKEAQSALPKGTPDALKQREQNNSQSDVEKIDRDVEIPYIGDF